MNLNNNFILAMLSFCLAGYASQPGLIKTQGIIIFERHNEFYFIETKEKDLAKLLKNNDTLKVIELASPYEGNNVPAFKSYLSKTIVFKSIIYSRHTIDYSGKHILYRDTADYKPGFIFYYRDNGYNLAKSLDKVLFNGSSTVYKIEPFISLDHFEPDR